MNIAEVNEWFLLLGNLGVGTIIGGVSIYFVLKTFIPSYLTEKSKNLATKEDIEGITNQVEAVKVGYAKILEEVRSDNQLRLASIEREKGIKKEVYLKVVEAISRSKDMIANFSNLDITNEEITKNMRDDSSVMIKVQVVGTQETVRATTEFIAAIGILTLDLMLERSTLLERKKSIEEEKSLKVKSKQEIDRYIELMKNLNLQGNKNKGTWGYIDKQIKFEEEQIDQCVNEIADLWDLQFPEHMIFTKKCMDGFFEVSALLPSIILAIRADLEMDISPENYLDIFNNDLDKGRLTFDKFMTKVCGKDE